MIKQQYDKFVPCGACNHGYIYSRKNKIGDQYAVKCECLKRYQVFLKLLRAGLSRSIINYSLDSYIGSESIENVIKVSDYIEYYKDKFRGVNLYLYGVNGTQKTTVAQHIGKELIIKGFTVRYVLMNEMIRKLMKEGFDDRVEEDIDQYMEVDCLIIDESFDKSKINWYNSDYQMSFLDSILRKRIDQLGKSIIFVSNMEVPSIKENFNNSLYDLIERNTIGTQLEFLDHYTMRDDFDPTSIWE